MALKYETVVVPLEGFETRDGSPPPPEVVERHRKALEHSFKQTDEANQAPPDKRPRAERRREKRTKTKAQKKIAKKTRAPNGTFDRTAYQREYMRKQRAKAKGETE
jgi:hypothetical protein